MALPRSSAAELAALVTEIPEILRRQEALALKLAAVTEALVEADAALAKRIERLEQMPLVTAPSGTLRIHEYEPERRSLLARMFKRG